MTDLKTIEDKFKGAVSSLDGLWSDIQTYIDNAAGEAQAELTKLRADYKDMEGKYNEAKDKVDHIEGQLNETVKRLEDMSKTTSKGVSAMQLLDVYLVLMEQVFESGPHVRLLLMLHGDKEEYSLNDLTTASGITGIQVRQALHELRNAGILDYDDETQLAKLKQRFL